MSYTINQHIKTPKKSIEHCISIKNTKSSINLYTMNNLNKINDTPISENNNIEIFFSYIDNTNMVSTYVKEYISDNGFSVKLIIKLIKEIISEALEYEIKVNANSIINNSNDFVVSEKLKLYNISKFLYFEDNFDLGYTFNI